MTDTHKKPSTDTVRRRHSEKVQESIDAYEKQHSTSDLLDKMNLSLGNAANKINESKRDFEALERRTKRVEDEQQRSSATRDTNRDSVIALLSELKDGVTAIKVDVAVVKTKIENIEEEHDRTRMIVDQMKTKQDAWDAADALELKEIKKSRRVMITKILVGFFSAIGAGLWAWWKAFKGLGG